MSQCSAHDLMEAASCYNCLEPRQTMIASLAALCAILKQLNPMASCDVNDLMADAACFGCLQGNQPMMVMLQLLCEILHSGGSGGTSCNLCGTADPTVAPSCDCSLYTRTDTAEMWYWKPDTAQWIKILSNT